MLSRAPCHNSGVWRSAKREEQRQFIREMTLRVQKSSEASIRSIDANTRTLEELAASIRDQRREFREEYEAHRGTLLAILDRLDLIDPRQGPATGT